MLIHPPSNCFARSSLSSNLLRENPIPLIQYLVAESTVGKTVRRQSAGLDTICSLPGSSMGRASFWISRAKNSLNVAYFSGSGSCHYQPCSTVAFCSDVRSDTFNCDNVDSRLKLLIKGQICSLLSDESYCLPILTLWSRNMAWVRFQCRAFSCSVP